MSFDRQEYRQREEERLAGVAEKEAADKLRLETPDPKNVALVQDIVSKLQSAAEANPDMTTLTLEFPDSTRRAAFARIMQSIIPDVNRVYDHFPKIEFGTRKDTFGNVSGTSVTIRSHNMIEALDIMELYAQNPANNKAMCNSVGPENLKIDDITVNQTPARGR